MTKIPIFQVDAFSDEIFFGNPAAIGEKHFPTASRARATPFGMETGLRRPNMDGKERLKKM